MNDDGDKAPPGSFVDAHAEAPADATPAAATSDVVVPDSRDIDAVSDAAPDDSEFKLASEDLPVDREKPEGAAAGAPQVDEEAAKPALQVDEEGAKPAHQADEKADHPSPAPETDAPDTKGKRKAPPAGLMLQDVPPPEARRSIEIDQDHVPSHASRSRASTLNRPFTPSMHHTPDSPTTTLIATLRNQLEMVGQQAEQLNAKLIGSISKHADLEDQVFALQTEKDSHTKQIDELARAKAQWEESMNTGLLVERSQIRDEMQRLAAGLVEEERKRGTAEEKTKKVEDEIDELSATLFDQANTMVATERMARAQAEQRLKDTEDSLAAAESAVRDMQTHLQSLTTAAATGPSAPQIPRRYLSSHPPYAEFRTLLAHLRAARPSQLSRRRPDVREIYPAPLVVSLVQQPFLARCIVEDHDPTLRLESAADLGWVSRRSVSSAIISGDLLIEPVGSASLGAPENLSCALCGRGVFGGGSASNKGLMKFFAAGTNTTTAHYASSVYVFRVATGTDKDTKSYPLCRNGWCLERLRAACALWHFVRTGIVHPVWFGEDSTDVQPATPRTASSATTEPGDDGTPVRIDLNATPPEADKLTVSPAPPPVHGQRSASAPIAAPVAITVQHLAEAEYRRPAPPPQRKSGWGLGSFSLGSGGKSSGGWSSWGSRPSTPATPAATQEHGGKERSVSAGVLGAPISLDPEEKEKGPVAIAEKEPVTVVAEKEPVVVVAEKEPDAVVGEDKAAVVDEKAVVPEEETVSDVTKPIEVPVTRTDSRTSHRSHGSTDVGSFATPTGDNASLPDVNSEEKEADGAVKTSDEASGEDASTATGTRATTPDAEAADSAANEAKPSSEEAASAPSSPPKAAAVSPSQSPSKPVNGTSPALPPRAAGRQPPPPPLPKRSLRRGVGSPTPPITPTAATDVSKDAKPPTPEAVSAEEGKVQPEIEVKSEDDTKPEAEIRVEAETKPELDAPAAAETAVSPSADDAPSTPTAATLAAASDATPTSLSPSRLPPPRHPLAIMRSPSTSPRSSIDGNTARPPPPRSSTDSTTTRPPPPSRRAISTSSAATSSSALTSESASTATNTANMDSEGRSFLTGEGWEARAWRQVVRLKEDMWRARVGVVDDDE